MIQRSLFIGMSRSAASAARIAMSTSGRTLGGVLAGALVSFAAHAANCSAPPVSGKVYNIVNEGSGLYLDVVGGRTDNGADVIQWAPTRGANQQWTLTKVGNDAWTLQAVHSKKSLDLANWRSDAGAPFKQWATSQNTNQLFFLRSQGSGAVNIVSRLSWQYVTADASNAKPGVYQDYDKSVASQRWFLNPADGSCSAGATGTWGSFMGRNKILIGGDIDEVTVGQLPFDLRYQYIHSNSAPFAQCYEKCWAGCDTGGWWGCWGSSQWDNSSGLTITWNNAHADNGNPGHPRIQQWTWYSAQDLGIAAGNLKKQYSGGDGSPDYKGAINNAGLLKGYLDDYRFFLNKIGKTNRNIIQLEPDFWGFLRETSGPNANNPHAMPAQVQTANPTDCSGEENSAAGLASCMIKMARDYASSSTVGIHTSCWDWGMADTATQGPKACTSYYRALGAGKGDFIVSDAADRDAKWAEIYTPNAGSYWWDDQKFANYLSLIKTLTEGVGKPMVIWQIPLGNEWQNNTMNNWRDNKVRYMFDRMEDLAKVHVVALQFGAGHHEQTSTKTDDGYFLMKAREYYGKGGVSMK